MHDLIHTTGSVLHTDGSQRETMTTMSIESDQNVIIVFLAHVKTNIPLCLYTEYKNENPLFQFHNDITCTIINLAISHHSILAVLVLEEWSEL